MVDVGRDVFKLLKNDDFLVLMIKGQIFLKEGEKGGGGAGTFQGFFQGNFFKVYHFYMFTCRTYFTPCKILLCIWRKKFFLPL